LSQALSEVDVTASPGVTSSYDAVNVRIVLPPVVSVIT
jgi:hypothetical protein